MFVKYCNHSCKLNVQNSILLFLYDLGMSTTYITATIKIKSFSKILHLIQEIVHCFTLIY